LAKEAKQHRDAALAALAKAKSDYEATLKRAKSEKNKKKRKELFTLAKA